MKSKKWQNKKWQNKKWLFASMLAALSLLLGSCQAITGQDAQTDELTASGMIEARQVNLASEIGGKVSQVMVEAGQQVQAGTPLLSLEVQSLQAQREQALANQQAAQANLERLKAGASQEQLRAAEAQLSQAEANLRMAQANLDTATGDTPPEQVQAVWENLQRVRANYQNMQVALSTDQVDAVLEALTTAESVQRRVQARHDGLANDSSNPDLVLSAAQSAQQDAGTAVEAARAAYQAVSDAQQTYFNQVRMTRLSWETAQDMEAQAQARLDGLEQEDGATTAGINAAEATLEDMQNLVDQCETAYESLTSGMASMQAQAAWEQVQQAQEDLAGFSTMRQPAAGMPSIESLLVQIDAAQAGRQVAAAQLDELRAGARAQEIQAAEANLQQAQAAVEAIQIQIDKSELTSPVDGWVTDLSVQPGEIATPGATLLRLSDLDQVKLTVYISETQIGKVKLGQAAQVSVDTFPERTFPGKVTFIAQQAEFTPENVQTEDQRANLVFKVQISLDNPEHLLKPGMPADVTL
ncbi:MAG: efflux RND transporter periplasmic adaptor subunit [Anaerolineales bacterium]